MSLRWHALALGRLCSLLFWHAWFHRASILAQQTSENNSKNEQILTTFMNYKQPDDFGSNKCSVKYAMQKKWSSAVSTSVDRTVVRAWSVSFSLLYVHVAEYAVTICEWLHKLSHISLCVSTLDTEVECVFCLACI